MIRTRGSRTRGSRAGRAPRRALAAVVAALAVGIGYAVVGHPAGTNADPTTPPTPPAGALDSLNRPVLIPGGFFWKGNPDPDTVSFGPYITHDETYEPKTVDAFWIQEHEVSNAEYHRFDPEHEFAAGMEHHPVVNVTWDQAMAYARSLGGRLPSETEWEFAARGVDSRKYPWGDEAPSCDRAQFDACEPGGTLEVMARPTGATPEGVYDLAGNVWEWVVPDWFLLGRFPANNEVRISRGGSFRDEPFFLRASNRNAGAGFYSSFRTDNLGFRVVWPVEGR